MGEQQRIVTEETLFLVLQNYVEDNFSIIKFDLAKASEKMLGYLSDYWKLLVWINVNNEVRKLFFFVKGVSRSNDAKATAARELKLFDKELAFYTILKKNIEITDMKPWSAKLVGVLDEAYIFEDLSTKGYKNLYKLITFDMDHTVRALDTVARFHSQSIIYEEQKSAKLQKPYRLKQEFGEFFDEGGYKETDTWFMQCMNGALEAVRSFSTYGQNEDIMNVIEKKWKDIWVAGVQLCDASTTHRNVICHRDLWSNNILFRYNDVSSGGGTSDCVLVDFQAFRYQPPAGDVMLLLYCNLDPKTREENMQFFLNYYYEELSRNLIDYNVSIEDVIPKEEFLKSAEEHRKWALVAFASILPQFWIDDDLTAKYFADSEQFKKILCVDKTSFIKQMMNENDDYKRKVLQVFEEIVERYCITT